MNACDNYVLATAAFEEYYALGYLIGDVDELALISSFNFNELHVSQPESFPRYMYLQSYMRTEYRLGHAINNSFQKITGKRSSIHGNNIHVIFVLALQPTRHDKSLACPHAHTQLKRTFSTCRQR